MQEVSPEFVAASKHFETIFKECSDNEKLKMYALWNQATSGDCTEKEPPMTAFVKRAKWQARMKLKGMNSVQAQKRYITELHRIDPTWSAGVSEVQRAAMNTKEVDDELAPTPTPSMAIGAASIQKTNSSSSLKPRLSGRFSRKSGSGTPKSLLSSSMEDAINAPPPVDDQTFQKAVDYATKSGIFKDSNNRAVLYGYYKQATEGQCNTSAPGMLAGSAKMARWRAWCALLDMSKAEAKAHYVARVRKIAGANFDAGKPVNRPESMVVQTQYDIMKNTAAITNPESTSVASVASPNQSGIAPVADNADAIGKACSEAHAKGGIVYFITGATGFVGKHLLERLLNRNPNSIMLCATREQSMSKLERFARDRFGKVNGTRIIGVKSDITAPLLGLDAGKLKALTGQVDHFFHIAAVYDMKASEEMNVKTNVGGTREAVKVANQINAKIFQHTSSIAVAGDHDGLFFETMFNEGQRFDQPYLQTKFDSEAIVRAECKVAWRVYRPGIIIGSSKTGEADKIDGVAYLYKPIQQCRKFLPANIVLPCIEGETQPIVPIDYVADAMDALAHMSGLNSRAFHLVDPSPPTLVELMNIFAKAAHAPQFSSRLPTLLMALLPKRIWSQLEGIPIIKNAPDAIAGAVLGVPESVMHYAQWRVQFDTADTMEALAGTGISCPPLKSYAWRCWDYFERFLDLRNVDRPMALREEVSGKTIVVTGASDGIGARLSARLAAQGARVIIVARSLDKLKVVGNEIRSKGGKAEEVVCDIAKGEDCVRAINEITKKFGTVDILINNAGRSIRRSVEYQYTPDRFHDFQRTIELNYYGAVRFMLGVLPGMRKQKDGQIVNISSVGVVTNAPRFGAYVASKAAMDGFSRCIGGEIHGDNVSITTVYMPLVATKMVVSEGNKFEHMNLLTTDEACEMIERGIVTKERIIMTLTARVLNVGYQLFPTLVEGLLHRLYKLEPEKAPTGQQDSSSAAGDKAQLRAIGSLLKGASMAEVEVTERN